MNDESSEDEPNLQPSSQPLTFDPRSTFHNPEDLVQFVIKGLFAKGLKKGLFFAPDPYVKFKIGPGYADHNSVYLPHHGQNCRTIVVENTTEPIWPEQVILLELNQYNFVHFLSSGMKKSISFFISLQNQTLLTRMIINI